MTDIQDWLDERETIHGMATEGPWLIGQHEHQGDIGYVFYGYDPHAGHIASTCPDLDGSRPNAAAIVDAHNTLPKLLRGVRAVLDVLDAGVRDGDDAETIRNVALMEIADGVLRMHRIIGTTGRTGRVVCCSCDRTWRDHAQYQRHLAQAIIDEFGLTVEERLTEFGIDDPGYQQRVVGKWERPGSKTSPTVQAIEGAINHE